MTERTRQRRVLFVSSVHPEPPFGGERIRCYHLLDGLSREYAVAFLSHEELTSEPLAQRVRSLPLLPAPLQGRSPRARFTRIGGLFRPRPAWSAALTEACDRFDPALIWFDYGFWGQYLADIPSPRVPTVLGTHNVQSDIVKGNLRPLPPGPRLVAARVRYHAQRWHERRYTGRFDCVVSVSEEDRRHYARFCGDGRSRLIPNFIDEERYRPEHPLPRGDSEMVMTANFASSQNRFGAEWLLEEVWPRIAARNPEARLALVGRGSEEVGRRFGSLPGVSVTGEVDSVVPWLRQAALAVVPIRHGSGARLKILEALACETPLVSTTLGARGIAVTNGESAIIADDTDAFARAAVRLLADRSEREMIAAAGLDVLRREYTLDVNTVRLVNLVEELVGP